MTSETKNRITDINNDIIPEGYKKTKVGIVPVEWETTSLGNYIVEHTEKSTENNQYPVLTSSRRGIFLQSDYYNKQVASEDNTGYNVVPFGYFTYRHMSDDEVFRFNINNIVEKGIVSTLYPVFTTHNLDDNWLLNTLNNGHEFQKYALIQKQGGSRTYMYLEKLKKLKLAIPPLPEQQKIAEILGTQDKLIELQERKINQLKTLKKAYLQKMFPKKGSKFPELRFKGFTDAWEQRKVLDLLVQPVTDGPHETPELVEEGIPFISVDAIVDNKIDFDRKRGYITEAYNRECCKKYKPQLLDVFLVKSGSTVGKVAIVDTTDNFNIWSPLAALRCGEKTSPYFLYFLLQTRDMQAQVSDKASNGTQPNLSMRELEKFGTIVPASIDEQKAIGNYFKSLDHLITLHQRKLDEEKQKKKALMQLLLTGKVRVKL